MNATIHSNIVAKFRRLGALSRKYYGSREFMFPDGTMIEPKLVFDKWSLLVFANELSGDNLVSCMEYANHYAEWLLNEMKVRGQHI